MFQTKKFVCIINILKQCCILICYFVGYKTFVDFVPLCSFTKLGYSKCIQSEYRCII